MSQALDRVSFVSSALSSLIDGEQGASRSLDFAANRGKTGSRPVAALATAGHGRKGGCGTFEHTRSGRARL